MSVPATDDLETGALERAVAGRYAIERELGRGGMGVVYLARDLALERAVAIKLLPRVLAAQPELRERFLRETRTAAGLSHPHIVPIHAVEERDGLVYYVMGFIDGESLTERVRRVGPLPPDEVARVLQESAEALAYAHERGIVHRDVKADNILLERGTGRAFLTDFGIARVADSTMTMAGQSLGTPQYMSPEQATGETVDARSDLYSLGVVGYFALTGTVPFTAPTVAAILAMQVTKAAPPVTSVRRDVPPKLAEAIDRCLEKDPAARWQSASQLVAALRTAQGAAGVEIAGPVRNFQRMAEMASVQVITIVSALPIMIVADAKLPLIVVYVAASLLVLAMQFAARTRDLLARGYTHDDVRAAFELEMRRREEEASHLGPQAAHARGAWRSVLQVTVGAAMLGAGVAIARDTHLYTTRGIIALLLIVLSIIIMATAVARRQDRWQRLDRRYARVTSRIWTGPIGRTFFRLLARGTSSRAHAAASGPSSANARSSALTTLLAELPAPLVRQLRDVRALLDTLEERVAALEARESELDRALSEAAVTLAPAPGESAGGAAHAPSASSAHDRRDALVADLTTARRAAAEERAALLQLLERFRLHFIRLRSGVGTVDDLAPELEEARRSVARS
ncbi:MAG TPA: serine/threonine-protein kinase [Gemmatimonadaceae bacterium]|nr:serine/threonine-protein kinase [Gemmatimonadaceae bacterium]